MSRRVGRAQGKASEPVTRQKLEQLALAYLNRFDVSAHKLAAHLTRRARALGGGDESQPWIQELLERYRSSGLLDDARFAKNLASQLGTRGKSTRAIEQKLKARGISGEVTGELMAQRKLEDPGAELAAALAYVRKRRLGPHRAPEERSAHWQKDLASLARQGFSFDIAKRALGPGASSDEDF